LEHPAGQKRSFWLPCEVMRRSMLQFDEKGWSRRMSGVVAFLAIVAAMALFIVIDCVRVQDKPWRRDPASKH
jgi:hypothetical protein